MTGKLELLDIYSSWVREPGIDDVRTHDWYVRGVKITRALFEVAETFALKEQCRANYIMCKKALLGSHLKLV